MTTKPDQAESLTAYQHRRKQLERIERQYERLERKLSELEQMLPNNDVLRDPNSPAPNKPK